ncbi:hypothetical protein IV203_038522 [Nitzschia inconspicua]|uniref:Uncharacterized protein n=2 Tax=Nitzschia inconspicua TaxID=303405 RepID=A0A9K3LP41_9STRA|nr:hypothetical protein IV203_038522 [Nitzschia inconspicua]
MHQLLHHRTLRFVYLAGRRIASVHSIVLHQRNGTPRYLAIASDTIGHQPLVSSDNLSLFHGFFLGIVQTDPTDGSPFPTLTEHRPADLPKNGTDGNNSHTDLGFPDATEATLPVFTLLPTVCPIPPGFPIPVGHDLSQPLPPASGNGYYKPFATWCAAVRHCIAHNNGCPVNSSPDNTLFNPKSFDTWTSLKNSETSTIGLESRWQIIPDYDATSTDGYEELMSVAPSALLYWHSATSLSDEESAFLAPERTPTPGPQPAGITADSLISLVKSISEARQSSDQLDPKDLNTLLTKFRLLLATVSDDSSVSLPELSPTVVAALKIRNKSERAALLRQAFENFMKARDKQPGANGLANFLPGQFDVALVNSICAFQFMEQALWFVRENIDRHVSIIQFLQVDPRDPNYLARVSTDNAVAQEDLADVDKSKRTTKNTHLFIRGSQRSVDDVVVAASNFLLFIEFLSPNGRFSTLFECIQAFIHSLTTFKGKYWASITIRKLPHLPHSLLNELQDIINIFVTISKDPDTVLSLAPNTDTDPSFLAPTFQKARASASDIVRHLEQTMHTSAAARFGTPNDSYFWFRDPEPKRPSALPEERPGASKKPRNSDDSKPSGFLVCHSKTIPRCDILFPVRTGTAFLCFGWCFVGHTCKNRPCTFAHINSMRAIVDKDIRQRLIQWVRDSPSISFAPGHGPPPEVPIPSHPLTSQDLTAIAVSQVLSQPTPPIIPHQSSSSPSDTISFPVHSPFLPQPQDPHLLPHGPMELQPTERDRLVMSLDPAVQDAINCTYGKPTLSISFCSEYVFRHVIPHLFASAFLDTTSTTALRDACPLYRLYEELVQEFSPFDTSLARGYRPFVGFRDETEINQSRVRHVSAALIQCGMNISRLVRWIGGPHLATHRDVPRILSTLQRSVDPDTLNDLERVFTVGSPRICQASSTEANFLSFFRYGNHASARNNPDKLMQVFVKDAKRGFTLVVDDRLLPFIRDTHLTPIGIVDLENPWKNDRPVFDSTFRPEPWCFAINDWTDKLNEPTLQFPGSFRRLLVWIWNLRISYPHEPILIGDNDICGAFRLVKFNPDVVPMHGYRVGPYLGFATGQTFGDNVSAANFEVCAIARQQHASFLWEHSPDEVLRRAAYYIQRMKFPPQSQDTLSFAAANADSQNPGVFLPNGDRKAPPYPHQVDDCMFADVHPHFPLTSAASIVALEDVFGSTHPCQEHVLSMDKLELEYSETRLVVGHVPNSRRMVVELSPRRRSKLLAFLHQERWLQPRMATLVEIATVVGMIDSAAEFFPWARVQVLVLQDLLRACIRSEYRRAIHSPALSTRLHDFQRQLPRSLADRFDQLQCRTIAEFVWRSRRRVQLNRACADALRVIHDYLRAEHPWEQPIGHIVPRDPAFRATTDASEQAIGVAIPSLALWCFLSLGATTRALTQLPQGHPDKLHINTLEFIGILLGFAMTETFISTSLSQYPPSPILFLECDNTAAVSWSRKRSTGSPSGRRLLQLFAEYQLLSPLGLVVEHIAGADNTLADLISRPCIPSAKRARILESLPPESRAAIAPTLDAVFRCELGATHKTKVVRHVRSMRIHFIWYLDEHKLIERVFPVVDLPLVTLNYVFACYAAHLGSGHTLSRRNIRSDTIRNYLYAAATLVQMFHPEGLDPRKEKGLHAICPSIDKVLKELRRWENIPDRREPYTVAMQLLFCSKATSSDPNSKVSALCDWFSVMLQAGGRRCEWAQPSHISDFQRTPEQNVRGDPAAFCIDDITFFRPGKRSLRLDDALADPNLPAMVAVCFRVQKNGAHGETKLFTQNTHDPSLCVVRRWLSIVQRFVRLAGRARHVPLAIYLDAPSSCVRYITATDVERQMRSLAAEIYDLDPVRDAKDLARFSAHSLRVGACCVLQALGFEEHEIERLLRWKSKTWRLYTRNLCVISQKHNKAIFDASTMPQF